MNAITSERKANSMSPKASRSTNPKTSGATDSSLSLKSFDLAVKPGDADLGVRERADRGRDDVVPQRRQRRLRGRVGAVAVDRDRDGRDRPGVVHVDRDRLVQLSLASACFSSWPIASCTCGSLTSAALTTTLAGISLPGNAACISVVRLDHGQRLRERLDARGWTVRSCSAGTASASSKPAGQDDREHRPPQDARDDRAPDPPLAVVAAEAAHEGDAPPLDPSPSQRGWPAGR